MTLSNNPPAFEAHSLHIEDLVAEAHNFLDGEPISTEGQATAVSALLDNLRKAKGAADQARKDEKKPHDDAATAVQVKWTPLLDKCDLAVSVAKKALTPWLEKLEAEQRAKEEAARLVAEKARAEALAKEREASETADLRAAETAQAAREVAIIAEKQATKAGKAKAHASGGARAIGLRTSWRAQVTDYVAFGAWLWANRRDEYREWLDAQASSMERARPVVPGVVYHEERSVA